MIKKGSGFIKCDLPAEMAISEMQLYITEIEKNSSLREEKNFDLRVDIIDSIGFQVIDQIEELLRKAAGSAKLNLLKYRAEAVRFDLEEINIKLFQRLQANIRIGGYTGKEFENLIKEYVDFNLGDNQLQEDPGYDNLDLFINGLSLFQTLPEQSNVLEPEMIYYQKTPARIVFELVERSHLPHFQYKFRTPAGLRPTKPCWEYQTARK